ncbi:MAG: Gfo/Idh/MocA family oxidoreductase [Phycisphaerales bacterium]|nr:Gfo/Idh/MocA family oxidoreductase [Phycisphaerales bacterium]
MSIPRIGIIGGGGIATSHMPQLLVRHNDVEMYAMADINPAVKEQQADKFHIPHFMTDWRELLPMVDAVAICVPTHLHADIAVEALRHNKHVFLEKPLARTMEQTKRVLGAAKESKGTLQIGFVRRFDEEWLAFRKVIQAGRIGRPVVWRSVAANAGPMIKWFTLDDQGGGPFIDGTIHNYDFALYTFGPAEWVFAHLRTMGPEHTALDTGTATIRFASGDELMLAWSWGLPPKCGADGAFDLIGPEGSMTWTRDIAQDAEDGEFVIHRESGREAVKFSRRALASAYDRQMDEFVDIILGRADKPRAGASEGYESMRISLAVLESGRTAKKVYLSEVT